MVTFCVTKMITTYSPMIGQFFDTMLVASIDNEWLEWPKSWKVMKKCFGHLNKDIDFSRFVYTIKSLRLAIK